MNEFDEFLGIEVPDQWAEIVGRAETTGHGAVGRARRRGSVLVLLGAVAAVVAMIAGFLVIDRTPQGIVVSPVTDPAVTEPAVTEPSAPDSAPAQSSTSQAPNEVPLGPSTRACGSETELTEIRDLFRSGQPTYDYTPARDIAELVERSAVVVTGTVASVQRQQGGSETYTVFDVEGAEVLAGAGEVGSFVTNSVWPVRDAPDPLGGGVELDGVQFLAFLVPLDLNSAPIRWHPNVEGLAFGCAGLPAQWLAGSTPDTDGLTVADVVALVGSSAEPDGITRPVFPASVCAATSARANSAPLTDDITFFARPSKNPIAIQVVGNSETKPAEPFAWVQRSFGDDREERELPGLRQRQRGGQLGRRRREPGLHPHPRAR